jgi:hypothetical protein
MMDATLNLGRLDSLVIAAKTKAPDSKAQVKCQT